MDVFVVTDRDGFVWGVYTSLRKGMARYEELKRTESGILKPQRKVMNKAPDYEPQDKSGTASD